jgi:hypothetical protein
MRRNSPPTFAASRMRGTGTVSRGDVRRPHRGIHSSRRIDFATRCLSKVLESSLSFGSLPGLVLAARPRWAYQDEHRPGRVPRHGNTQVCCRRRGANSSRRNDLPRLGRWLACQNCSYGTRSLPDDTNLMRSAWAFAILDHLQGGSFRRATDSTVCCTFADAW